MTFMDVQLMKSAGSWAPRSDGEWMLYTVTTPDWEEASSQSDSRKIYVIRADSFDEAEKERREKGFTVDIKNMVTPLSNLWVVGVGGGEAEQLTADPSISIDDFVLSDDGKWIGITGGSAKRYERNITGAGLYGDLFLLETATGEIERLTDNYEVGEGGITFSPDGRWVAFGAPDDMTRYTMTETRVYIREVEDRGGPFRKLGSAFDGSVGSGFWSEDGGTLYFRAGIEVTNQLMALDIESGNVRQVTFERASLSVNRDEDSGRYLVSYQDPRTPSTVFAIPSLDRITDRSSWVQLVDVNPQVREGPWGRKWRSTGPLQMERRWGAY
jgi:Tol biopolymer transport system component